MISKKYVVYIKPEPHINRILRYSSAYYDDELDALDELKEAMNMYDVAFIKEENIEEWTEKLKRL